MKPGPGLPAKLSPPRLVGVVRRERLFKLLDERRRQPVVWVAGPPGVGKTTLVASYIAARKLPAVWYRVDSGDGDAATFLHYLGLAIAQVSARKHPPLPALTSEYPLSGLEGFVRRYVRDAFARMPRPSVLVLDSFQELSGSPDFRTALLTAFDEVPEGVNLFLASRTEPGPEAARHFANQRLGTLGWDELRFTPEESLALLGQDGEAAQAAAVHETAGGWAAGLVLLREHLRRTGESAGALSGASREAVFDYFAGEIFASVPAEEQRLLTIIALLPYVPASLAEAITGNPEAGKMLDRLRRRNLFVSRRPGSPPEYELHTLFREFLLARGRRILSAEERRSLQRRMAELLEAHDRPEDALLLYRQSEDWPATARLILRQAPQVLAQGRRQTLADWLRALPGAEMETNPWLSYWLGMASMASSPAAARAPLEAAYEGFLAGNDSHGQILAAAAMVESYYIEFDDFSPLDKWIAALERLLGEARDYPSASVELRAVSSMLVALFHRQPNHSLLPAMARRAWEMLDRDLDPNQQATTGAFLLNYYDWVGDFDAAGRLVARLSALLARPDINPLRRVVWQVRLARHYALQGDAETTVESFAQAQVLVGEEGLAFYQRILCSLQLYTALSLDDVAGAARYAVGLADLLEPNRRFDSAVYHMGHAWIGLQRGDLGAAAKHAESAVSVSRQTGLIGLTRLALLLQAEAQTENGVPQDAQSSLESARAAGGGPDNPFMAYRIRLAEANLAYAEGDRARAADLLKSAFSDGARHRYLSNYLWLPKVMARLCTLALEHGIEVDYTQRLIRRHGLRPESNDIPEWPWPNRIYTLGRFALVKDGEPLSASGKTQKKPLELLKVLIALGGRDVDCLALMQHLWPEAEGDAARTSFDTALHRLRRLLGNETALPLAEGRLSLDPQLVWVDAWAFERLCGRFHDLLGHAPKGDPAVLADMEVAADRALKLYHGHFLAREADEPWGLSARDRLRSRWLRLTVALGQYLELQDRWSDAVTCYRRGLELDNLAEELYRRLMICHRERGEHAEALNVYRRCRELLSIVLGVAPSAETEAIVRTLRAR